MLLWLGYCGFVLQKFVLFVSSCFRFACVALLLVIVFLLCFDLLIVVLCVISCVLDFWVI